jgi:hypothetical protein
MLAKKIMHYYSVRHSLYMTLEGQSRAHFLRLQFFPDRYCTTWYNIFTQRWRGNRREINPRHAKCDFYNS